MSKEVDKFVKELEAKLKLAMPEVHRQVKVYEDNLKNGTLKPLPNNNNNNPYLITIKNK